MDITFIQFSSVTSTQEWVRAWAQLGAPEGLTVQALEQRAGRGRLERSWWSPSGKGLYISVLLRPQVPPVSASLLTMLVSLAAIDACRQITGAVPQPKWPNDLVLSDRKLAGVLTELEYEADGLIYAIIGLGLNVDMDFSGSELAHNAISLRQVTGRWVSLSDLRDAYLLALCQRYGRFLTGWSPLTDWREHLYPLGKRVQVKQGGGQVLVGLAVDVNSQGGLLVQDENGIVHTIWTGDVVVQ